MALSMTTPATTKAMHHQLIKGERHLFASSDDNSVMKQIQSTHAPDGREVDVRPLLHIVEDVLQRAKPTVVVSPQQAHMDVLSDVDTKFHQAGIMGALEALAYTIHRIACEISYKCTTSGGGDAHATTMAVLHLLSNYTWESKVSVAMAAFAVSYGEFWLTAQLHTVNPLAKSIALLKQLPDILEHTDTLRPRFEALNNLITVMLNVTKCIVEFKELPSEYITADAPELSLAIAHIPTAVYWTIRSVIACASQIIGLIGLGNECISSTTEAWELSSLAHKLTNIHGHLTKQLSLCQHFIDDKKHIESYHALVRLFETIHLDNHKILRALFYSKDDLPLVDGVTKKRVSVDVLRRKIIILFVTDLEVSPEELFILDQLYRDTHQGKLDRHYEIVWLPVIDRLKPWTPAKEEAFKTLAGAMIWYTVAHPLQVDLATIKYIREMWHFDKKPLLVVLDPHGKVVCPNALHMMWIWGSLAFPFTSAREEALWKEETWRLEFLVDEIDQLVLQWSREGRYVCLYGGENIDWIRRFTATMSRVAKEANISLEMLYVGKSSPRERVRKAVATITTEKLSSVWQDPAMIWFFWVRLESMWHSKRQHGKTMEDDAIMHEVMTLLSYDGGDEGWAVFCHGSTAFVKAHGKMMLDCLLQFDTWKANVERVGFLPALEAALQPLHTPEHCTRLILPGDTGKFQEQVACAECRRPMEKYVLYRCCNN